METIQETSSDFHDISTIIFYNTLDINALFLFDDYSFKVTFTLS